MLLHAFRGYRYSETSGDPGRLAAPPFDQIDSELRGRLHRLDELHFSHLTRPVGESSREAARHAAGLHRAWTADGTVVRDPRPGLYPYAIDLAQGGRRLGICGLARIEPPGSDQIRPHEHTVSKTVAERLELLWATRVDLEPILLLSDDPGSLDELLEEELAGATPTTRHRDPDGNVHLLYSALDGTRIAAYQRALETVPSVIADGHHRYRVAQLFAEEAGPEAGAAARCKLVVVTSLHSPGVTIEPIHRLLRRRLETPDGGAVLSRHEWSGDTGGEMAAAVAASPQPAVGVWQAGRRPEIWRLDPEAGPKRLAPAASQLSVVLLHDPLLRPLGPHAATDGTILYRSDPDEPWRAIAKGEAEAAIWLPPMPAEAFAAAVERGDLLPPKSTRFVPKLVSGLVWSGHDSELA